MVEDRGSFLLPSNASMMHTYQYSINYGREELLNGIRIYRCAAD